MPNKKTFNSKHATPDPNWEYAQNPDDNYDDNYDDDGSIPGGWNIDDDGNNEDTWHPHPDLGVTPVLTNNPDDLIHNTSPFVVKNDSQVRSQQKGVRRRKPVVKDLVMPFQLMTPQEAEDRGTRILTTEELDKKRQEEQGIPLTPEQTLLHAGPVAMNVLASQSTSHQCSKCDGTGQSGIYEVRNGLGTRPVPCSECHGYGHTDLDPSALGEVMDVKTTIGTIEQHRQMHDKRCHRLRCVPHCCYKPFIDPIRKSMQERGMRIQDKDVKVRTGSTPELRELLARRVVSDLWQPTAAGLIAYGGRNRLAGAASDVQSIGPGSIVGIANHSLEFPFGLPRSSTTHIEQLTNRFNADSTIEMLPNADRSIMALVDRVARNGRSWDGWVDARSSGEIAAHEKMWREIRKASGRYPYELRQIDDMYNNLHLSSNEHGTFRKRLQAITNEWGSLFGRKSTAPYAVTLSAQPRVSGGESTGSNLVYRKNIPMGITYLHSPHSAVASRLYGTRTGKRIQTLAGDAQETDDVVAQSLRGNNSFSLASLLRHIQFGDDDGRLLSALRSIDESRGGTPGDEDDPFNLTPKAALIGKRVDLDPETITIMNSKGYKSLGSTSGRYGTTPLRNPDIDISDDMYDTDEFKDFLKTAIEADEQQRLNGKSLTVEQIAQGVEAMRSNRSVDIAHAKRAIFKDYLS